MNGAQIKVNAIETVGRRERERKKRVKEGDTRGRTGKKERKTEHTSRSKGRHSP